MATLRLLPLAATLALALTSRAAAGDVLIVDATGAGDFSDLQPAVDAAKNGDTLLVRAGAYSAPVLVDRDLSIVADEGAAVVVNGLFRVSGMGPLRSLLLSGLQLEGGTNGAGVGTWTMVISANMGSVRLDDCELSGHDGTDLKDGGGGLLVDRCMDVALIRCRLEGGDGGNPTYDNPTIAGQGLSVTDSEVALYRSLVFGGAGGYGVGENPGGYAAAAAELSGTSTLYSFYCFFQGGDGGGSDDYISPVCTDGQPGLIVRAKSTAHEQASVFVGGKGGYSSAFDHYCNDAPGTLILGSLIPLSGSPRALITQRVVREAEQYQLEVFGQAGDEVWLFASTESDFTFLPGRHGGWLLARRAPGLRVPLGSIGGGGSLKVDRTQPGLGAGVEGILFYLQVVVRDSSGVLHLSNPVALQALDSSIK